MDDLKLSPVSGPRVCGCKGIRSCRLCMATDAKAKEVFTAPRMTFNYCIHCSKAWQEENTSMPQKCNETATSQSQENAAALGNLGNYETQTADLNGVARSEDTPGVNNFPEESQQSKSHIHLQPTPRLDRVSREASSCSHNEPPVESFPEESQESSISIHLEACFRLDGVSRDTSSCSHNASSEDEPQIESFPEESHQSNTHIHLEACLGLDGVSRDVSSCSDNVISEDKPPVESFHEESRQFNTSIHLKANPNLDGASRDASSCSHNASHKIDFEGIVILEDFVSEAEEADLDRTIAGTQFVNSQSGRRKQDFGPKVNFKKQKVRTANFTGLPSYSQFLYQRMKAHPQLSDFEPVELCNLEYCQRRGAHIDPHFDDDWLWGERLVTLNLLSDSVLTFTLDSEPGVAVRVPLLRRSLIVVAAAARYSWKHSILPEDVVGRRVAMTFRELSKEFRSGGSKGQQGAELLKLALTFSGSAVGS